MACKAEFKALAEALSELAQCGALTEILAQAGIRAVPAPEVVPAGWGLLSAETTPTGAAANCTSCAAMGKQVTEVPDDPNMPFIGSLDDEGNWR